ncbi:serine hydrolase domain-containing protein [Psychromicrobium sp. YIM B11713]|uniref:serine hydrolase domain-containing protein n=1 Tax=Psychromicrobium sp. YIM B11713 TaxID=3145233 RepID=UPI00374ECC38
MSDFSQLWRSVDDAVATGRMPGAVAGVRHHGVTEFHPSGTLDFGSGRQMTESTPFRIASLSKPLAGALGALLIQDQVFGPDDPVDRWLPELTSPRVLRDPDGPLSETEPAESPITVRHLLTGTLGVGVNFTATPLAEATQAAKIGAGIFPPEMTADEYMARLAELPLAHQPGSRWRYNTAADVLSVLLSRASGMPLSRLLEQRITGPLGMSGTGFFAAASELPPLYMPEAEGLKVIDSAEGRFSRRPQFETLAGGLVSTVPDYFAFLTALVDGRLLPQKLKEQMVSDQLSEEQREGAFPFLDSEISWGWQIAVNIAEGENSISVGSYGWTGGSGTNALADPGRDLIGVVFSQRAIAGPDDNFNYFWSPLADLAPAEH